MAEIPILGVPIDMGAGRRGVDMGASAIRLAGLSDALLALGHDVYDLGNVEVPVFETLKKDPSHLDVIAEVCNNVYKRLQDVSKTCTPIILGGDHSISMGTIAGMAKQGRTGVLWVDAHTDINTFDTSPTGNIHGMPLAHLLGQGDSKLLDIWGGGAVIRPEDLVYIGLRSVDGKEREIIQDLGITAYTMKEIDMEGMATIVQKAIKQLSHLDRVHVSFDADALDPSIAPGVGTPVSGGLSYREAHLLMELLHDAEIVTSLDLVEVNPILDIENRTAKIMVEMTASLLGKAIL